MTKLFNEPRRVHFVGIGGVGMSGIAEVLLTLGHRVSGSDMSESDATRRLVSRGATVTIGHRGEAVQADVDVVVISSAVKYSNPEVAQARALKIPVIPRAEMLAELMRLKYGIAVAGTHGKTTTTSLIAAILARAGLDPTTVIGGKVHGMGTNARLGQGELLVAEADESDGTFLMLSPVIGVVTNIDPEHLDYYGDMDRVRAAYLEFMNRVPFYGVSVLCLDSVNVRSLLPQVRKRVITYGTTDDCDYVARDLCVIGMETMCEVVRNGEVLGTLRLRLPGRHHALNAVAAIAVTTQLGVPFEVAAEALGEFGGIHRRFELCGEAGGVMVVSDYGHHPAEIRATLAAAREGFGRRLVVCFQPHRFTRTRDLFGEFLDAFDAADHLVLTDIYAAGEEPVDGLSGEVLFWALKRRGHLEVSYVPKRDDLVSELKPLLQVGDLVVVLGAGNIHGVAEELVHSLIGAHQQTWTMQ
ncbi:MAG: UDP-N-acetylmuramate--L-alanine ligase [Deltaproteobacteria bacterium]|nr:UDP-N-acetylmuramate--L-alanine ligase [Deltaproteobacteria bacterium]